MSPAAGCPGGSCGPARCFSGLCPFCSVLERASDRPPPARSPLSPAPRRALGAAGTKCPALTRCRLCPQEGGVVAGTVAGDRARGLHPQQLRGPSRLAGDRRVSIPPGASPSRSSRIAQLWPSPPALCPPPVAGAKTPPAHTALALWSLTEVVVCSAPAPGGSLRASAGRMRSGCCWALGTWSDPS